MIHVQHGDDEGLAAAGGALDFLLDHFHQGAPVQEARQGIAAGGLFQRRVQVAHHALVVIGDTGNAGKAAQLPVELFAQAHFALVRHGLVGVGQVGDALDPRHLLGRVPPQVLERLAQGVSGVGRVRQQAADAFVQLGVAGLHWRPTTENGKVQSSLNSSASSPTRSLRMS